MSDPPVLSNTMVRRDGPQSRLLVLLHGYGQPVGELTDRLDMIDPGGRFCVAVPDAPFAWRGQAIWHRAISRAEAEEQYLASLAAIDALLGDLEQRCGLPAADAVVGGFSQGGGLALGLLLGAEVCHRPAAGFGICSFPPAVQGFRVDRAAAAGRPYLLSSAREDHFASIEVSRAGATLLREVGIDLTYLEVDGRHVMTDAAAVTAGAWLTALHRGDTPPSGDLLAEVGGHDAFFDGLWEHVS